MNNNIVRTEFLKSSSLLLSVHSDEYYIAVGWGFIGVALFWYGYLVFLVRHYRKNVYSGTTLGVIIETGMNGGRPYRSWNFIYVPFVKYEYMIDGKKYFSTTVGVMGAYTAKWIARLLLKKYRIGESVLVYYDLSNPKRAVLKPKSWKAFIVFMFSVISMFLIFGLLVTTQQIQLR